MHQGFVLDWVFDDGVGIILGCSMHPPREFRFFGSRCCQELQQQLALPENSAIHAPNVCPGIGCIQVSFDVDLNGDAVNICEV